LTAIRLEQERLKTYNGDSNEIWSLTPNASFVLRRIEVRINEVRSRSVFQFVFVLGQW
jgi:hypothetical protein